MKISVIEPLGLSEKELREIAKPLVDMGHELVIYNDKTSDIEKLKKRVCDSEVIVVANMPLAGEIIISDKKLKMISIAFTGVDHVDLKSCSRDVIVSNAAGYSTSSVAELSILFTLSLLRNVIPLDTKVRQGGTKDGFSQQDLSGKTFGVVGTGEIGSEVCRLASAFGCNVLAYNRSEKEDLEKIGVKYVDLDTLLQKSDVVSIHLPQNESTIGLMSREKIALMKSTAILVNAARGPIVDNKALAEALYEGKLAGAGVDVFDGEPPLPEAYSLLKAPNTVLTPHIGFATKEAMVRRAHITFENITKWIDGTPQNLVKF